MRHLRFVMLAAGVCMLAGWWSGSAAAQATIVVACDDGDCEDSWDGIGVDNIRPTIQGAVDHALSRVAATNLQYTVLIGNSATGQPSWTESVRIPADANLIVTTGNPSSDHPLDTVVRSADLAEPVFTIGMANDPDAPTDRLVIEALTLSEGLHGVHVEGSAASPVLNRLYIVDHANHGVLIESSAERSPDGDAGPVRIVNSSISRNGGDGVRIVDGDNTNEVDAYIVLSSMIENDGYGVRVEGDNATATVEFSLMFDNGQDGLSADAQTGPGGEDKVTAIRNVSVGNAGDDYSNVDDSDDGFIVRNTDPVDPQDPPYTEDDVQLVSGSWLGKLQGDSALIGLTGATTISGDVEGLEERDFEGEGRPFGDLDIGADEADALPVAGLMFLCNVDPNPIPAMPPGRLRVTVRASGREIVEGRLFIVPHGGRWDILEHRLPLRIISGAGTGFVIATNATELRTTNVETIGGTIDHIDGHGMVRLVDQAGTSLVDAIGQAIRGQHVIIDTIPPRITLSETPRALAFLFDSNDGFVASQVLGGNHPVINGQQAPPEFLPGGQAWPPAVLPVPEDDGLVTFTELDQQGRGGQLFFNVGSVTNNLVAEDLQLTLAATFVDPPLLDANGVPVAAFDDFTNTARVRDISGFPALTGTPVIRSLANASAQGVGRIVLDTGLSDPMPDQHVRIVRNTSTSPDASPVWNLGGTGFVDPLDLLDVTWEFVRDSSGTLPGIDYDLVDPVLSAGKLHFAVRFVAQDRAGNITTQRSSLRLNPLHVWWITDTEARILESRDGQELRTQDAAFTWDLNRGYDPQAQGAPEPVFAYRIYLSTTGNYGDNGESANYTPLIPWSPWSTSRGIGPAVFQEIANDPGFPPQGAWLMLVVLGADEAGNVSPWPVLDLGNYSGGDVVLGAAGSGPNWQRFRLAGTEEALDTTLNAVPWIDRGPAAGNNPRTIDGGERALQGTIYPAPPPGSSRRIEVRFNVNMIGYETDRRGVVWELQRGGQRVAFGHAFPVTSAAGGPVIDSTRNSVQIQIPLDTISDGLESEYDSFQRSFSVFPDQRGTLDEGLTPLYDAQGRGRAVQYTFRAATFIDERTTGGEDPSVRVVGRADTTPASFSFTVTPHSDAGGYLDPKDLTDDQPIQIYEQQ